MEQKELNEKYCGVDILTLEKMADGSIRGSRESQRQFIEVLIYLKATNRYKENKLYAKSSFKLYIEERFHLREAAFYEMQRAFVKFPQETIDHGIGLVAKVLRICEPLETKKVFGEIAKASEGKIIKREQIEKIIQRHKKPEIPKMVEQRDWKALYVREVEEHNKTRTALYQAEGQIAELEAQIVKLKATAKVVSEMRRVMNRPEMGAAVG